jgi:hypothetical protein
MTSERHGMEDKFQVHIRRFKRGGDDFGLASTSRPIEMQRDEPAHDMKLPGTLTAFQTDASEKTEHHERGRA